MQLVFNNPDSVKVTLVVIDVGSAMKWPLIIVMTLQWTEGEEERVKLNKV